ncbi:protein TonB [Paraburkholderia sp. GAS333]|uniref:energy transducer TonB n=1 Tax=Paraburkholderia sp. GAS333 TaxID=3156279 RepID=UPI003D1C85EA
MSSRASFSTLLDNAPQFRLALGISAGLLVWLAVLVEMGRWIATTQSMPVHEKPLEMRMVELEPPPMKNAAPAANHPMPAMPPKTRVPQQHPQTLREKQPAQTTSPKPEPQPQKNLTPTTPDAKPVSNTAPHTGPTTPENAPSAQPTASPVNSAAHSIAQPLPALPDDLREQAYQTVATARFMIHADGSVDVELIKPTSSPRLNQILLEALHRWRFFPALQNGHPIESQQEIRVHFNVD